MIASTRRSGRTGRNRSARLIVASNRSLEEEVAAGRFRSDLYHRLNVVTFRIPALRERQAAIQPLAEQFLAVFSQCAERPIRGFTRAGAGGHVDLRLAGQYSRVAQRGRAPPWRFALRPRSIWRTCPSRSRRADAPHRREELPASARFPTGNKLAAARTDGELQRLLAALGRHNHNRTNTAAELGISRVTLYKKLRQHRLA